MRAYVGTSLQVYNNLDVSFVSYPEDDVVDDCEAYIKALKEQKKGSCVIIFTPGSVLIIVAKKQRQDLIEYSLQMRFTACQIPHTTQSRNKLFTMGCMC